jgi:HK97 family phage portal protein
MDNFITRLLGRKKQQEVREFDDFNYNPLLGTMTFTAFNNYTSSKSMKLSAVYRAVQVISDSIAVMPLENYTYKDNWKYRTYDDLYYLLNVQPSENMSAYTLKKMIVQNVLLNGNAYVKIIRKAGKVIKLELLNSNDIEVVLVGGLKKYAQFSTSEVIDDFDMIHIMNGYSENGYIGISTISSGSIALGISYASEEMALNVFEKGAMPSAILTAVQGINISKEKADKAKQAFQEALNTNLGGSAGSLVVLDAGLTYTPITVSNKDSQLLESRQFNIITIAQIFGVSPVKLFDLSKSSYATVEASQLDFLVSTIQPLAEKIELEFFRKLYSKVEYDKSELKFDTSVLLRMDSQAQAAFYTQMFNIGVLSPNEIRAKINADYPIKGGNEHWLQVNLQKVSDPVVQNNNNTIDNNLKQ